MADPRLVDYIIKANNYGYSKDQIKSLLINQGWYENEIEEAFREAGISTLTETGESGNEKKNIGFIMSLLSGLLVILDGAVLRTSDFLGFTLVEIVSPNMTLELIMLSLIFGLGIILGSVLIYKGKNMVGGSLVIVMSLISMITFIGLIIGLIGIVAGIFGILRK